ncbi:MAG: DinB family protein [Acidimicrobiia bacterium]|nr:DinB family protein [Acidimicrobiia bacterium]
MLLDTVAEPEDPGRRNDELTTLSAFLDFYRTVMLRKGSGLTPDQLATTTAASTLTIASLIRHMTLVEDHWFDATFAGLPEREPWASADWDADRDWEMTTANGMTFVDLRTDFDEACERSRSHVAAATSLDVLAIGGDPTDRVSLRWILIHMIEEYARHCGHADLLREALDGRVGD